MIVLASDPTAFLAGLCFGGLCGFFVAVLMLDRRQR